MARPNENEYASFYKNYIALVVGNNLTEVVENHAKNIHQFISNIPEEKADFAYTKDKWTVKDLVQHIIDAERIFIYRATRFARKDKQDLLGFEENEYAANANTQNKSLQSLKDELLYLRKSTDIFLVNLDSEQLSESGKANNNTITVNAIGFIIFGHILHHINILQERYL